MKNIRGLVCAAVLCSMAFSLVACFDNDGDGSGTPGSGSGDSGSQPTPEQKLALMVQIGDKVFFDKNLSGGKNMSCASCHDPAFAYGPPNSLAVQLGSDPSQSGTRAVPSLRYKDVIPPYEDDAPNPDGITQSAPGGGFMWDGRAATLAAQAALPLLNPLEMNNGTPAAVVQAVQASSYAALFKQAFGDSIFDDVDTAFADIGQALQAYQREDRDFHPYSSKFDLYANNKIGGTMTAAELRGMNLFNSDGVNCLACHFPGANFNGSNALMTDFTYQSIGAPRNDGSIPSNPSPIPANQDPDHYDMGLCGPDRTDHMPSAPGAADSFCGLFKVPSLRNVATRGAFFHNGVFHSLNQVVHFYNTRDTNPEFWYPETGGSGTPVDNPSWALQPRHTPGATVNKFNDLPDPYKGNVDEEIPMGTGENTLGADDNTLGGGMAPREPGSAPVMSDQDIQDVVCFLDTLTDGYQIPAQPPTSGPCVN